MKETVSNVVGCTIAYDRYARVSTSSIIQRIGENKEMDILTILLVVLVVVLIARLI